MQKLTIQITSDNGFKALRALEVFDPIASVMCSVHLAFYAPSAAFMHHH
jgi:hypothetical protein